jgi:hypothetical protein
VANTSYYLEALLQFDRPATVKEVHDKAREMFGEAVKGDRGSCRLSLDRQVGHGRAKKEGVKYEATRLGFDPITELTIKIRTLETKVSTLEAENTRLQKQVEELS